MNTQFNFLSQIEHRPWKMPAKPWQYYQEWNDVLFLHFEVNYNELKELVPPDLPLDSFEGRYYVSVVAFKMEHIRPAYLPSISFISDFYEINVRTYVKKNEKSGVYFINIEAAKKLAALVAKTLSGLPYEESDIIRNKKAYTNHNILKKFNLDAVFEVKDQINKKTKLGIWLTERYCLFLKKNNAIRIFEIHHKEWEIFNVNILNLEINYRFKALTIDNYKMVLCHYSPGVQVVSWNYNII